MFKICIESIVTLFYVEISKRYFHFIQNYIFEGLEVTTFVVTITPLAQGSLFPGRKEHTVFSFLIIFAKRQN